MGFTSCNKTTTCPCPDVILDTQIVKFEKNITISYYFPNLTNPYSSIIINGWTRNGDLDITRSFFTIPSLSNIDSRYKIKSAHFVLYGDLTSYFDDRIDTDTSFIYLTKGASSSISTITWNNQPSIIPNTKINVLPPYQRIGKARIDATDVINRIRNGELPNNVFLFRLKEETWYRHKSYKGVNSEIPEEAPALELVLEKPLDDI
jgi:hypothetical protein